MWLMLQQDEPGDYVLATGECHSVRDFVDAAFAEVGTTIAWSGEGVAEKATCTATGRLLVEIDPRYFRPTEVELLISDPSKVKRVLGWSATKHFADLVAEMVREDLAALTRQASDESSVVRANLRDAHRG